MLMQRPIGPNSSGASKRLYVIAYLCRKGRSCHDTIEVICVVGFYSFSIIVNSFCKVVQCRISSICPIFSKHIKKSFPVVYIPRLVCNMTSNTESMIPVLFHLDCLVYLFFG